MFGDFSALIPKKVSLWLPIALSLHQECPCIKCPHKDKPLYMQVEQLMYQLNSDSEGDEGSDIDPEAEISDSDDAEAESNSNAADDQVDDAAAKEAGTEAAIELEDSPPGPSNHAGPSSGAAGSAKDSAVSESRAESTAQPAAAPPAAQDSASNALQPSKGQSETPLVVDLVDDDNAQQQGASRGTDALNNASPSGRSITPARAVGSAASPASPALSSARKHKQADIRGFMSPKSVRT